MTWIKDRKFLIGLSAVTLLLVAASVWYGKAGKSRYEKARAAYEQAAADAENFEKLAIYPTKENVDSKKLALSEYGTATKALQDAFAVYRPAEQPSISPQDLSAQMKAANDETRKAFGQATAVPDDYYCGFKAYGSKVAAGEATGILSYQLGIVKQMMLDLAAAQPTKLIGIYRPELAEEIGNKPEIGKDDVARGLPIEVAFQGTEKSVRQFVSSIANHNNRYVVIRSMRIKSTKLDPPRSTDAQFDRAAPAAPSAGGPASGTTELFGLFAEAAAPAGASPAGASPAGASPAGASPAALPTTDSSRILFQVLGNEEIIVFLRLDIMQFLPAKSLP